MAEKMPEKTPLPQKLQRLPARPGVYLYKNTAGKVIYVGKAKNLRTRVRSYFQNSRPQDGKTRVMVNKISDLETIIVDSEVEALILEANLIKKYKPRYNINLRDDKSYPYIRITNEPFPRLFVTRKLVRDGSRYLGPYTDVKHLRQIIKTVRKIFPIRSCNFFLDEAVIAARKVKLCLDYHIQRCQGPCEGLVSETDYRRMIDRVEQFLRGKTRELCVELRQRMEEAAANLRFEEAARLRDQIRMIENYGFRSQKMAVTDFEDRDVIALAADLDDACAVVFKIRDGKVVNRQHFYLSGVREQEEAAILSQFLKQYYITTDLLPRQILLPLPPREEAILAEWLNGLAAHKIQLIVPQIGEKRKLIRLCQKNARFLLEELLLQKALKKGKLPYNVQSLQEALKLPSPPRRIEAFDISNIQGKDAVASMVCFVDGKPAKKEYRHFNIRSENTPNDFVMMREVVFRRYRRLLDEKKPLPDLILIDGGKGQLSSAVSALNQLHITNQPILGLAKRLEEIFFPGHSEPQTLPRRSAGLRLLQALRDEAHRFAIGHFRKKHRKSTLKSILDDVPGIGPKRKKALLKQFGSLRRIKEQDVESLVRKGKLPRPVAEKLVARLQNGAAPAS